MKILKIEADGLPLFKEKLSIDFYAVQRILEDHKMNLYPVSSSMHINPAIAITRNEDGICLEKLSDVLKRNDIKKSDVYQSGMLEGTTTTYSSYIEVKKDIKAALEV